jgi:protein phosphatase
MSTTAHESTPAARASALAAPRPAAPDPDDAAPAPATRDDDADRPRRSPARTAVLLVVLLGLLLGGLWFGWSYTQSQYYVGATKDGKLAVFQGVPGQIAGFDLSSIHQTSETDINDLTAVAQERVRQGIQARSESDAERTLAELTSNDPTNPNRKPDCPPTPSPSPSPTPALTPTPTSTQRGAAVPTTSVTGTPNATAASVTASPTEPVPPGTDPTGCTEQD